MKKCVWVKPEIVAQIEFLEWTDADRLRHSKFAGLRDGKDQRSVVKEQARRALNNFLLARHLRAICQRGGANHLRIVNLTLLRRPELLFVGWSRRQQRHGVV